MTRLPFPSSGWIMCVRCGERYAACRCDPATGWPKPVPKPVTNPLRRARDDRAVRTMISGGIAR